MKKTLGGLLVFVIMIAVLLGLLQVLNWIPAAVQEGAFRKYASIEEVRAHLKINPVYYAGILPAERPMAPRPHRGTDETVYRRPDRIHEKR